MGKGRKEFYAAQIINPFLNSWISANHEKVERLSANSEIIVKGIVSLLYKYNNI